MITLLKIIGFFLLILVGYHYVNEPLGFSIAGSLATGIFAICLLSIQETYEPDKKIWIGWGLISSGCLLLAAFTSFSFFLLAPMDFFYNKAPSELGIFKPNSHAIWKNYLALHEFIGRYWYQVYYK